ncbi:uracil-DNA glycosylase [Thermodesulfobacteriota bacterium B35]
MAQEVRRLLRFHLALGLDVYPASGQLRSFLDAHSADRPGPVTPPAALRRQRPGPEPGRRQAVESRQPADAALEELGRAVQACSLCGLAENGPHRSRGTGAEAPRLLVVGDWALRDRSGAGRIFGPGEDEMLARMMTALGLGRDDYHVTNVLKCSPATASPPSRATAACRPWLEREIAILRPQLICAMGELATQVLTGSSQPLARLHGRFHGCRYAADRTPQVLPTYHPRLLLRQQELKKVAWQDLQKIRRYLARSRGRTRHRAPTAVPRRSTP